MIDVDAAAGELFVFKRYHVDGAKHGGSSGSQLLVASDSLHVTGNHRDVYVLTHRSTLAECLRQVDQTIESALSIVVTRLAHTPRIHDLVRLRVQLFEQRIVIAARV